MFRFSSLSLSGFVLSATLVGAFANEADVVSAQARMVGENSWQISATIRHADEGWEHFANRFEVVTPNGDVVGIRELAHPHVNEQPFTRSLSSVIIPKDIPYVIIRARDSVHGYGGAEFKLELK